jgi:methyl-accepting chemotaxis protein
MSFSNLSAPTIKVLEDGETARRVSLLRTFCTIGIVFSGCGISIVIILTFVLQFQLAALMALSLILVMSVTSRWLAGGESYRVATWLYVGGLTLAIYGAFFSYPTEFPILTALLLPLLVSMSLQDFKESVWVIGFTLLFATGVLIVEDVLNIYKGLVNFTPADLIPARFIVVLLLMPILLSVVYFPSRQKEKLLAAQNKKLVTALEELEERQIDAARVSKEVLQLSAELKVAASQQASGSQEQASSLVQVTTSLMELSQAASHIDVIAQQVSHTSELMVEGSQQLEITAQENDTCSEYGLQAVKRTAEASQEVASLYSDLLGTLKELNAKSVNSRKILELLKSIAEETHLLSLNASIEAAGAGEYGGRFAVVAQEVKNLSSRSNQASQEVVTVVQQIELTAAQAVVAVEQGFNKARKMEQVVGEAGQAIEEMLVVSSRARSEADSIHHLAGQVQELSDTIKIATGQQQSASQQVLDAISGVSVVAQQSAAGSNNLTNAARNLEAMSNVLTESLGI